MAIGGTEPLQAALSRFGWEDVRSILAAHGSAPPFQVVVGERLSAAGLPSVPRRELASYRLDGMTALPLEHLEEPLEPQLLEGLKRLKLRRMRQWAAAYWGYANR